MHQGDGLELLKVTGTVGSVAPAGSFVVTTPCTTFQDGDRVVLNQGGLRTFRTVYIEGRYAILRMRDGMLPDIKVLRSCLGIANKILFVIKSKGAWACLWLVLVGG